MNSSDGRLTVIMRKRKSSLPLLLPTEMKWKVQLSRGSMVSPMEAVRERERERAGRVKHQHTADTQRNVTHIKTHNSNVTAL